MEIRDLSNSQGLLPMRLGRAKVIRTYNNLIHIIRLNKYEENIDRITDSITSLKNTDELKDSLRITELKLDEVKYKLQTLMPKHRSRRGIIDGLGTIIKGITGNMDANDAIRINKEIESIIVNQALIKTEINKQTRINARMIERFDNVTSHINKQQEVIENYLKYTQDQMYNKINSEEAIVKHIQYLNQINYNIDLLNNHLTNIAEAVMLARMNVISKHILSPEELTEIYYIFKNQSIDIKSDEHIYELLNLQAYYNHSNIIFSVQIPITVNEDYSLFHLISLPVNKTNKVISKPYAILSPENIQYFDKACSRIEEIFYCNESPDQERVNKSRCVGRIIKNLPAECNLLIESDISEIIQPEPNYILMINIPKTTITSNCDFKQQEVKGTLLIYFEGCKVQINGITYEGRTNIYWDDIRIYPSTFVQIRPKSVAEKLTLEKLKSYHIQNRETIQFLQTKLQETSNITYGISTTFGSIITVAVVITILLHLKKNQRIRYDINSTQTISAPATDELPKDQCLWPPSLHLRGEELHTHDTHM